MCCDHIYYYSHSLYPWLSVRVVQDGHWLWVWHSVTHEGWAKHPGQVVHIHLSIYTLRHPVGRNEQEIKFQTDLHYRPQHPLLWCEHRINKSFF